METRLQPADKPLDSGLLLADTNAALNRKALLMSELVIRIPVILEIRLDDSALQDIYTDIEDALGEEAGEEITNNHVKEYLVEAFNDDFEPAYGNYSHDMHIDESKIEMKVE